MITTFIFVIIGLAAISSFTINVALAQTDNGSNNNSDTLGQKLNLTNTSLMNGSNMSNITTPTGNANTYR
ncbi:hypothetical protein [Candidatus Nitrosocosmicus sp. SS]|jgi:hypothetical protein|uniref:hypothetical protein n=1 Tax=Candidatus Nitrosocosmicus agrestis TaxID=2563600 RepID=UPI00122DD929|nr:hypothetical protein [Candidatus Nitrosocosmicus sp. SS]KAA2279709.1 hypothetical protein F1Z66_12545 [Candidatus Nitrosocosmicus sp. SS]KAF0868782.1 hypothetical protein E5N71_07175 [Candidatus Nitrosocosmicus sp. SS]MDR4490895.1 hypothetical protein [Candidatus Nitrosocosmicus sp.]